MSYSPLKLMTIVCTSLLLTACGSDGFYQRRILGKKQNETKRDPQICERGDIQRIALTEDHTTGSTAFMYAFQYVAPTVPGAPTIVYIPGGPGQTSIGDQDDWLASLPDGYGLVLTDPRGVGCNYRDIEEIGSADFFRSTHVAKDVLSAVKHLNLTNYSLYGISYGTVVATMAGSYAEREDWPKPASVVLEGVLGRTFASDDEADGTYARLWREKLERLEATVGKPAADQFRVGPLPLGRTAEEWLKLLRMALMVGGNYDESGVATDLTYRIIERSVSASAEHRASIERFFVSLAAYDRGYTSGSNEFYGYIACREIWPSLSGLSFEGGEFVRDGENYCRDMGLRIDRHYDPAKWPISAPIYYLQGVNDPATPEPIARHHFDSATSSPARQYLLVKEAGHNPFSASMGDCSDAIWTAMTSNAAFADAVKRCRWQPGFELVTEADGVAQSEQIEPGRNTHGGSSLLERSNGELGSLLLRSELDR